MFEGFIDQYANPENGNDGMTVRIGGVDVLAAVDAAFDHKQVVTLAVCHASFPEEKFSGGIYVDLGMRGYSEYTPGEAGDLLTGPHSLRTVLDKSRNQSVTVWIADEPIDLGEEI